MSIQLLISIRDASEVAAASQPGVDVIDIKNPAAGSLGAPSPETAESILVALADRPLPCPARISAAMGELNEWSPNHPLQSWLTHRAARHPLHYAKIGLRDARRRPDWQPLWHQWAETIPSQVEPVAVAYADFEPAASPDLWQTLEACPARCRGILVDTCVKDGRGLLQHVALDELRRWMEQVQRSGRWVALAGSLTVGALATLIPLSPRYFAVRGCVCDRGREGHISSRRVIQLVDSLQKLCDQPIVGET